MTSPITPAPVVSDAQDMEKLPLVTIEHDDAFGWGVMLYGEPVKCLFTTKADAEAWLRAALLSPDGPIAAMQAEHRREVEKQRNIWDGALKECERLAREDHARIEGLRKALERAEGALNEAECVIDADAEPVTFQRVQMVRHAINAALSPQLGKEGE